MAKLRTYVHVKDEQGQTHAFGPDDTVPAWAQALITNPKAWAEPPTPADEPAPAPAPAKKAAPAKRAPARRKADADAVHSG